MRHSSKTEFFVLIVTTMEMAAAQFVKENVNVETMLPVLKLSSLLPIETEEASLIYAVEVSQVHFCGFFALH
jgi:hypothetical protein